MPAISLHGALWWALAATIAALGAILFWMLVTPVSPLGAWRPAEVRVLSPPARAALFASFDPFNRSSVSAQAAVQNVTALALTLYGVRLNAATGGGSAIIAGPDGVQQVYKVGAEVQPGVMLAGVHFDYVELSRNGARELLYIDQSKPAIPAGAALAHTPTGLVAQPAGAPGPLTVDSVRQGIALQPQAENGRVTGLQVSADGDGAAFRAAGFQPGDVIVGIAGKPVGGAADGVALMNSLKPGAAVAVTVRRGGQQLPMAISLSQ